MIAALLACSEPAAPSDANPDVLVTGASDDYGVGALYGIDADRRATPLLATLTGDAWVRRVDGLVAVLNRYNHDTLALYEPGVWDPVVEVALPDLSNPWDIASCGDGTALLALYGTSALLRVDLSDGSAVGEVDLSSHADADGVAEPTSFGRIGDRLFVALARMDRDDGWAPRDGRIVEITCDAVVDSWDVGHAPVLHPWPDAVLLQTGAYYVEGDGQVALWTPDSHEVLWDEGSEDVVDVAAFPGGDVLIASTDGADHVFRCQDGAEVHRAPEFAAFVQEAQGAVWVGLRAAQGGRIAVFDGCGEPTDVAVPMSPYDLAGP